MFVLQLDGGEDINVVDVAVKIPKSKHKLEKREVDLMRYISYNSRWFDYNLSIYISIMRHPNVIRMLKYIPESNR